MSGEEGFNKIMKHSTDKVIQLLKILKEYDPAIVNSNGK